MELISIPSITANKKHSLKAVEWLSKYLNEFLKIKILKTNGNPIIIAFTEPQQHQKPTILIYGHYDVQPVEPLDAWISPPFEPEIRNGRLYGRGTGDNKGQFFTHISALISLLETESLESNVILMLDGDEELGSPDLGDILKQNKNLLDGIDLVVASDGPAHASWKPGICFGCRGIIKIQIYVKTALHDRHSGNFGGLQPNPITALVEILKSMRNEEGRCLIKGFYDDVEIPDAIDLQIIEEYHITPEQLKKDLQINYFGGEHEFPIYHRAMFRPTVNIHG
ncbi:MAG: M20/M25/M40 family metallo-hydrolase, partial [Candidatus Hodarchaeales archaeon]